jgi:hypothetical protein|tara:strand:- start:85 stop:237 length:153 start_codon:yes stop_codon:yes gene_type:complete
MSTNDQNPSNGQNSQVNDARNNFNQKVDKLAMLGKTKKVQWDAKRRHRAI